MVVGSCICCQVERAAGLARGERHQKRLVNVTDQLSKCEPPIVWRRVRAIKCPFLIADEFDLVAGNGVDRADGMLVVPHS